MAKNNEDQSRWIEERLNALGIPQEFQPDRGRGEARLRAREIGTARRSLWIQASAAIAVLCLAPLALPAPRSFAQRVLHLVLRVDVAGVRQPAPDFVLTAADGQTVKLSSYRGKVVLLNFGATWCGPCTREIPWFMEFEKTYKDRGFAVVGVSVDEAGWDAVRPFISDLGVNYPVLLSESGKLPELYQKIEALPTTFLIDREGRIAGTHDSLATKAVYEEWILKLLNR